jgi:hypothetical protein
MLASPNEDTDPNLSTATKLFATKALNALWLMFFVVGFVFMG